MPSCLQNQVTHENSNKGLTLFSNCTHLYFHTFRFMKNTILLLCVCAFISCAQQPASQATVIKRDGFQKMLETPKEKIQIINFWATWCAPCIEELPVFERLLANYGDEVEVTLISLDDVDKLDTKVNPFLTKENIQATVYLLDDPYAAEWIPMVDAHWDGAIPVTLIKSSTKSRFYNQEFTYGELEKALKTFM